ncbi:MAG: LysM peptidoglycan-binding domain-containing protein, partial [Bacteroidales bacterium]
MPRKFRIFFAFIVVSVFFYSPETISQVPVKVSENKVIIEGNIYYLHIVKPGQTLYSISKAYRISEKAIAIENPGVYSGLQVGQVLKIPAEAPEEISDTKEIDTSNFISHELKEGETFFSLSRSYNVSAKEIENANPGIDVTDLSIGQVILIPKPKTVRSDKNFTSHKVRRKETLYSLARRYGITEDEIRKYNPEIQWGGLKTGMVLQIPKPEFLSQMKERADSITIAQDTALTIKIDTLEEDISYIDSLGLEEMDLEDYYYNLKDFNSRKLKVAYMIP